MTEFFSRTLAPGEREAVLGDLEECGESAPAALLHLLSLFVRRQAALWQHWRPWLGLFGVAGLAGFSLSRFVLLLSSSVMLQIRTYKRYGVHYEHGLTFSEDFTYLTCLFIALLIWLWASGFALGRLSGQATWLTGSLFLFAVADSFWLFLVSSGDIILRSQHSFFVLVLLQLLSSPIFITFPVVIWGMRQGVQCRVPHVWTMRAIAGMVVCLTGVLIWYQCREEAAINAMSAQGLSASAWPTKLPPFLLASLPVWYLLAVPAPRTRRVMEWKAK